MSSVLNPNRVVEVRLDTAQVVGKADLINGVFGSSRTQSGVVGLSENYVGVSGDGRFMGVSGTSRSGTGVSGESNSAQGVGVHGKGGRLAGLFEGNVEVTGGLSVRGVTIASLLDRIAVLEDELRQLQPQSNLEDRVTKLEQGLAVVATTVVSLASAQHIHT